MGKVTLVGKHQARRGYRFLYAGPAEECKKCKLSKLCHSLNEGWSYEVVKVRDVSHKCPLHEEGVIVVEVEELPLHLAIPRKEAIEGAVITVKGGDCKGTPPPGIGKSLICCNPYLKENRVRITKILGAVNCGTDEELVEVLMERAE